MHFSVNSYMRRSSMALLYYSECSQLKAENKLITQLKEI